MTINLLVVEDDPQLRLLIQFVFEDSSDFNFYLAANEFQAMKMMDEIHMDAVITDLQLNSHEGGLSVVQMAVDYDIPIAIMTADVASPEDEYTQMGVSWVIRKPFDTTILPQIARRLASLNE